VKSPVENESDIRERNQYGKEKGGPEQYDRDPEHEEGRTTRTQMVAMLATLLQRQMGKQRRETRKRI
jgi:hypothetical protein